MPEFDPVFGKFPRASLLGATVVDFTGSASWGEQSSQITITLVEDPDNGPDGDDYLLKKGNVAYDNGDYMGSVVSFEYGSFRFDGIVKSSTESRGFDGNPLFRLVMASPVEVLDACQVILNGYVGSSNDARFNSFPTTASFEVSNFLNVYGYAEDGGNFFGRSAVTEIGMPWVGTYGIKNILETLTNTAPAGFGSSTNYGSYIRYKGQSYRLDLSNLPVPPNYYMLGGVVHMSLLELLSKFFQDAGCDYMVKLTIGQGNNPHTISFVVVPRFVQQPLGKIAQYISGQSNIIHSSSGQELRSDITQAFLVGGSLNILEPLQNAGVNNLTISPFWGFDLNGNPIIGSRPDGSQTADDDYAMYLNGSSISDLLGLVGISPPMYYTNILELRCALGNYDTWVLYLRRYKPDFANSLELYGALESEDASNAETMTDLISDSPQMVDQLDGMYDDDHWPKVAQRLYEFVREQANTYYGKKFIVKLPFQVQVKVDPNTFDVTFNNELADAGFAPEGSQILGLNYVNENFFLDQTGRFYPFIRYLFTSTFNSVSIQKTLTPSVTYLNGSSSVVQYNANPAFSYVYSRCEQGVTGPILQDGLISGGGQIFFVPNGIGSVVPAIVVTAPDTVWADAEDVAGSTRDLAAIIQMDVDILRGILSERNTSVNLMIQPPAFYPEAVAVAIKNNQFLYGPWGQFQKHGKLEFEQDEGLVPWEYGGYDLMNQAAIAKLNTIAKGNQTLERGDINEAGLPTQSLGDVLIDGGPIINNITCSISTNEVTTTYTMETFVNRIGAFSLENADRLKRIGKLYQQLRRTMRQFIIEKQVQSTIMQKNYLGFMFGATYATQQHSPHGTLGGNLHENLDGTFTPSVWTVTHQESLALLNSRNSNKFQSTACAGMESLFRPYTHDINNLRLSYLFKPDPQYNTSSLITSSTGNVGLNPIRAGCDFSWLSSGSGYTRMKVKPSASGTTSVDFETVRSLALRGPLVIQSWGFDLQGHPYPNQGSAASGSNYPDYFANIQNLNGEFFSGHLKKSNLWPTGPLDLAWDKFRSVWASRGMVLTGTASGTIPANSNSGYMRLYVNDGPSEEFLFVSEFLSSDIPDGTKMGCCYDPLNNKWRVVMADCNTG